MLGLEPLDIAVIVAYFAAVMAIGFWAARRVATEEDFFLGGRRFGKALLVMHWLCTGTHSEQAVQVSGATARVGLGGIWYQWIWLFSTPFYWLIAPIMRRLRVTTTGDFFRIRYGRGLEMLYSAVALLYFTISIAMLLRGAGAAISGATGGAAPTNLSVVALAVLFATYITAGGLVSAAYTDALQGVMIIVLSVMLVPFGLAAIGGAEGLNSGLAPEMLAITAPAGEPEGDFWFVVANSILGLAGIVVQPHVMAATGSGKAETEARVGMCYGNFIKRLLTIAWAFTGLIALVRFSDVLAGLDGDELKNASETLFGRAIRDFLGVGWRGLMIACLIAGVTSAETLMVVGSSLVTRNFYSHVAKGRSDRHYLWAGRVCAAGMLAISIPLALYGGSVAGLYMMSIQVIGLMGAAFWLGVTWRRANAAGVWASVAITLFVKAALTLDTKTIETWGSFGERLAPLASAAESINLHLLSASVETLILLAVEFGTLILVSLVTPPPRREILDAFFARLYTPVGKEPEVAWRDPPRTLPESATLGLDDVRLDYNLASKYAYQRLLPLGIEIPRLTWFDWAGFVVAWVLVGGLIGLLVALASAVGG